VLSAAVEGHETGDRIEVTVRNAEGPGEVWLLATSTTRTVSPTHGENASKFLTYTNVVRRATRLGQVRPNASTVYRVSRAEAIPPDADSFVLIVQRSAGAVIGAARRQMLASAGRR
jgi:hypothetical protein